MSRSWTCSKKARLIPPAAATPARGRMSTTSMPRAESLARKADGDSACATASCKRPLWSFTLYRYSAIFQVSFTLHAPSASSPRVGHLRPDNALEVFRSAGFGERLLQRDEVVAHELCQVRLQGLHTELPAHLNCRIDLSCLRLPDQVGNSRGVDHDLEGQAAPPGYGRATGLLRYLRQKSLSQDGNKAAGQHYTYLLLL